MTETSKDLKPRLAKKHLAIIFASAFVFICVIVYFFAGEHYYSNGMAQEIVGDLDSSQDSYSRALWFFGIFGKTDKKLDTLHSLMSVYSRLGKPELSRQAAERYRKVLEQGSKTDDTNAALAEARAVEAYYYYMMDRNEEALEILRLAIADDPFNPRATYVLGLISMQTGDRMKAIEMFTKAIEEGKKRSDKALSSYYLGRAEAQALIDNYRLANDDSKRALENGLEDVSVWMVIIKSSIYLAEFDKAKDYCLQALKIYPGHSIFTSYLATIAMLNLDFVTAESLFKGVVGGGGALTQEAEFSLGISYYCLKKWEDARRSIMNAFEVDPVLSSVMLFLIELRSQQGRERAFESLVLRTSQVDSPRLNFYLQVFQKLHDWDDLTKLLSLRKTRFESIELERAALGKYQVVFRPPLSELPWEEIAYVCGASAIINSEPEVAKKFFGTALDTKHYFYWVYILSKHAATEPGD